MNTQRKMLRKIGLAMFLVTLAAVGLAYSAEAAQTDMETLAIFGIGLSAVLVAGSFIP